MTSSPRAGAPATPYQPSITESFGVPAKSINKESQWRVANPSYSSSCEPKILGRLVQVRRTHRKEENQT